MAEYSQTEQAFRSMLIHKAEGRDHDALATLHALTRPRGFPEVDWVNAIHAIALGAKTHPKAVFRFVEMALLSWAFTKSIRLDSAYPTRLGRGAWPVFTEYHVNRLVRINGTLYHTLGTVGGGGDWIGLVPVATSTFAKPNWTATRNVQARFLPFRVRAVGAGYALSLAEAEQPETAVAIADAPVEEYHVILDARDFPIPARTYLRSHEADARTAPVIGGILCPTSAYDTNGFSSRFGIYLDGGNRLRQLKPAVHEVLPATSIVKIFAGGDIWR